MKRILFVELIGGLGDLVIALPAIHALALSHPGSHMSVLTFPPGAELLEADPLVHAVRRAARGDKEHPDRPRQALEALLAAERFDLIVADTTYAGISSLLESTGVRVVSNLWRRPPADQLIEERFLQILGEEGLVEPWALSMKARISLDAADHLWAASHFPHPGHRAMLYPHSGMAIKLWPAERYVALGRALRDELSLQLVVASGQGAEVRAAEEIARQLGPDTIVLPSCSLRQFAAAATYADLVVGADTGPVRVAAAVGSLTIALFGPSWHGRYGLRRPNTNLQGYPQCQERVIADFTREPCWYAGVCPLGHWQTCLEDISVGDVLEAAGHLLDLRTWWGRPLAREAP